MKTFGIVSFNIYCNFTNYGSALQSWALSQAVGRLGARAKLIDYCPESLKLANPLMPFKLMWDKDDESRRLCEMSMPAIRENYVKYRNFFENRFDKTVKKYTADTFNDVVKDENINGFVCGGDTIFCTKEFGGFDDGYFANYSVMKEGYSFSYGASFGDTEFDEATYPILNERLKNFKAIGVRENRFVDYIKSHVNVPVQRTIDPTLLLSAEDYDAIVSGRLVKDRYLLVYSRRYNKEMFDYADAVAAENGWKVVDISLRADNAGRHLMFYHAGVEEFLSLVKHSEYFVTNSFHGLIFAAIYGRPMKVFTRESANSKIAEVMDVIGSETEWNRQRDRSIAFLRSAIDGCYR